MADRIFVRPPEAAALLNVSKRQLHRMTRARILSCYRPSRRLTLFSVEELRRDMRRFRVAAIGEGHDNGAQTRR